MILSPLFIWRPDVNVKDNLGRWGHQASSNLGSLLAPYSEDPTFFLNYTDQNTGLEGVRNDHLILR